jgi:EAL domain-containing protein (putative c-di-GMP-specific phosphodiesterase class I)
VSLLERILAPGALTPVFQPILDLEPGNAHVHAVECLMRGPGGTNAASALVLFEYVRRKRAEAPVDRECIRVALEAGRVLAGSTRLSLNVHASTLGGDPGFPEYLARVAEASQVPTGRLTLEIVEHSPYWNAPGFFRAVAELRHLGACIALDDVGVAYSNFKMILDCEPDFLKIDHYLVAGIAGDQRRRTILASFAELARELGSRPVAEGIENADDLAVVTDLGVELVQGMLLGAPEPAAQLNLERPLPLSVQAMATRQVTRRQRRTPNPVA